MIAACHALDVAAIPGCYTPTQILDAWDAGADIVKVFPATGLGAGVSEGRACAAAAGQADADRRRLDRNAVTGFGPGRSRSASARRCSRSAIADGRFGVLRATPNGSSRSPRGARSSLMARVVTSARSCCG